MKNNRSVSAAIGEYLVLGELLKRNVEAYLAHGETQKGWDLILVIDECTKRVQVKTIDWPNQLAVNGHFEGGFDYLVVVLLDRGRPRSKFFVFEHSELDSLLSAPNALRVSGARTLTMSKISLASRFAANEDNWRILMPLPTQSTQDVLHADNVHLE